MANIVLLGRCNLRCPYCFAENYTHGENEDITDDTFAHLLDFAAPDKEIGLIGGEPLLHKNIDTYLDILSDDPRFLRVTVFTNGIFINKHIKSLLDKKIILLINVNSSGDIGRENFSQIDENIGMLCEYGMKERITLGINIYEENQNFEDFLYLVKKYNFKKVRVSVVIPKDRSEGAINYFMRMKQTMLSFYKELAALNVCPCYDCNAIPECVYTEEEKAFLSTLPYSNDTERDIFMGKRSVCSPIIDLYPDMTSSRCFGCSGEPRLKIKDFYNITDLRNCFFFSTDSVLVHIPSRSECEDCYKFKTFSCFGGCLCYKKSAEK